MDLLEDDPVRTLVGAYLSLLAIAFLLWFVGSLRSRLRAVEGDTGWLSAMAFGGGVAAATSMLVGFAAIAAAAMRADSAAGISPDTAIVLYDLYRSLLVTAAIGFSVLVGATAIVSIRHEVFPTWFVWSSVVLAVALVSPLLFFFVIVAFVWVLVVGIWLYRIGRQSDQSRPVAR